MSYETAKAHIVGLAPCIMQSGRLANPLDPMAKEIKKITAKRTSMTEDDRIEVMHLEFLAGLYLTGKGEPCWPGENIEIMVRTAARSQKKGKNVERGLTCDGNWPLIYDGPKDPEKLWLVEKHRLIVSVGLNQKRVMRCRPIFPEWELKFEIGWRPDVCDFEDVRQWLEIAGRDVGLSTWRPKYGMFDVESLELIG